MGTFRNLMNLFFNQLIDVNVQQGLPENNPALKHQCLLLMDEFPALGKMSVIVNAVAFIAGYNLRLLIINQSPSQLEDIYGKEAARTLTTNFACRVLYTPRDQKDAQEYSEIIGYETFKSRSSSRSSGRGTSRSQSISDQKRAVMNPDEMKTMPASDCIVTLNKVRPIYAQKIIYWQDPVFTARLDKTKYPVPKIPELDLPIPQAHSSQNQSVNHIQPANEPEIRQPENPQPKTEPLSVEEMASFEWEKCVNKEAVRESVLALMIRKGTNDTPENMQAVKDLPDLWLLDKMPETAALLAENPIETTENET